MNPFGTSYRWSRRPFANIAHVFRTLFIHLPSNIWRYLPWLMHDDDFDSGYLIEVMEFKLRAMSVYFQRSQLVDGWEAMVSETKETADILARMEDDDESLARHGYDRYETFSSDEKREMWERVRADRDADRKRFGELMQRIQYWWD